MDATSFWVALAAMTYTLIGVRVAWVAWDQTIDPSRGICAVSGVLWPLWVGIIGIAVAVCGVMPTFRNTTAER